MTDQYYNVERLIQALREPRIVFSAHWDTFRLPYGDPQDEGIKALRSFGEKLKKVLSKIDIQGAGALRDTPPRFFAWRRSQSALISRGLPRRVADLFVPIRDNLP